MVEMRYDVYSVDCPTRAVLDLVADKWTTLLIGLLQQRPHRFGELRRAATGITAKMLTQTLRHLEDHGLVTRTVLPTRPVRVEYSLAPLGVSLAGPLAALRDWAQDNMPQVQEALDRAAAREPDHQPA